MNYNLDFRGATLPGNPVFWTISQGGKERMKEVKEQFGTLMGPILGFVEKSAPNQVTGGFSQKGVINNTLMIQVP